MEKITILIADDHKLIRETWRYMLELESSFEVIADCGDAQEAVNIARIKKPHIILMDIDMPPFSGIEATKQVRKFSPGTRTIAVSMHSHPTYVKKMFHAGAKGFITKNSPREEMILGITEVNNGNEFICSEIRIVMDKVEKNSGELIPDINSLTSREVEIISLIKSGKSSREIGEVLYISLKTVQGHRQNIHKKLKLNNTASLMNYINNCQPLILTET
jgi:DNA-binding NarL/FixJ family response regulator